MFNSISKILGRPPLYTKTEVAFWNDEHISKQMLKAHLDPEFEGASRKLKFIEKSIARIKEIVPPLDYPLIFDIGCGPGIYAEKFSQEGYQVTGIDFSKRSIDYAKKSAIQQGLNITYLYQNYLDMDLNTAFDFSTMIYCDYGALSTSDRQTIMSKVYHHLKPGGKFLFDVFSMAKYNAFQEKQIWEICHNGGFWREDKYLELKGCYKYSDNVTLEQTSIISNGEMLSYYIWDTCFTQETLVKEAKESGFKVCEVFGDVAGSSYQKDSFTIAILLEK
ncbi:methyltransferase domain-containing protein [Alkalibaculum sp. M08DMB]|uniref:Methyltransferase domain-containing protein n=1 Tax=Alkalibaculum sporogenes TaxID=2655001 RepID=A0A6A7K9S5_9FIRM|nr:class I SAM-dependent methyltransferase [Alkalibaculum sporogenes]MPW26146.1 methyltransferase domain-containing protein [Alkalibaculum sporogenes]